MMTFLEYAEVLENAARACKLQLDVPTEACMIGVERDAKTKIGHYQAGWAELTEFTLADKAKQGFGVPNPLLRTGQLRDSIEQRAELSAGGAEGVVGSNDLVAAYHEMGTRHMPARPYLAQAMAEAKPLMEREFGEFLVKVLSGK